MHFLTQSFIPVYADPTVKQLGDCSMIIGGAILYLKPDEAWPHCATCGHPLVPLVQLNASNQATMFQLFVCPQEECYNTSTGYSTDTRSWLVRVATVPIIVSPVDGTARSAARAKIEQSTGFLPVHVVEAWAAGKEETLDQELCWDQDDSEEFYAAHEPESGLKLLGHTVRGKYYCSDDECPRAGPHKHPSRRELIQLGDLHCEWGEDEALGMMATLGNTWIEQCVDHPEVLTLTMSGNW
ncbi:hypothetical protein B0H14DRAFT_2939193 [Mycena olivaceomarginata]|nr:hypothetical protein B0H14DRAFT_2939193 [Mycena olivaceomarginata]